MSNTYVVTGVLVMLYVTIIMIINFALSSRMVSACTKLSQDIQDTTSRSNNAITGVSMSIALLMCPLWISDFKYGWTSKGYIPFDFFWKWIAIPLSLTIFASACFLLNTVMGSQFVCDDDSAATKTSNGWGDGHSSIITMSGILVGMTGISFIASCIMAYLYFKETDDEILAKADKIGMEYATPSTAKADFIGKYKGQKKALEKAIEVSDGNLDKTVKFKELIEQLDRMIEEANIKRIAKEIYRETLNVKTEVEKLKILTKICSDPEYVEIQTRVITELIALKPSFASKISVNICEPGALDKAVNASLEATYNAEAARLKTVFLNKLEKDRKAYVEDKCKLLNKDGTKNKVIEAFFRDPTIDAFTKTNKINCEGIQSASTGAPTTFPTNTHTILQEASSGQHNLPASSSKELPTSTIQTAANQLSTQLYLTNKGPPSSVLDNPFLYNPFLQSKFRPKRSTKKFFNQLRRNMKKH